MLNRLTNRSSINGYSISYAYSVTGQRTNMTDLSGSTVYVYDIRDRLTNKLVAWTGGPSIALNYRYDVSGNMTHLWSGTTSGVTNFYQYDPLSRLTNVLGRDSVSAGYRFDGVGNLQSVRYGSGVTNLYQYDRLNRLTNTVWKLNANTFGSFDYKLGLSGMRTNLDETLNGTRSYAWRYDARYRLTNENISAIGSLGYGYDPVGNRTNRTSGVSGLANQTPAYNTNDWLTTDTYDNNGNTTASSGAAYQYDAENRLTDVNSGAILIAYDGDGNRVKKTVGTTTTYYLVDDRSPSGYAQVVEEYQSISAGAATLTTVYTYGFDLITQRRSGNVRYFCYDGHGSTRLLTDTSGNITDTYVYDAYGTKLSASTGTTPNNYLYCGEQFDADLGFYYLRARYYKPDIGRFWTKDAFEGSQSDPLSLHKYLYAHGNPVNMVDPTGMFSASETLSVSGIQGTINSALGTLNTVHRIYSGAQNFLDLLDYAQMAVEIVDAFAQPSVGAVQAALMQAIQKRFGANGVADLTSGLQKAFDEIGPHWSDISSAIQQKAPIIAADAARAVAGNRAKLMQTKGRFEPIFFTPSGPGPHVSDTYVKLGRVHIGVSPSGGRLFGFGYMTGQGRAQADRAVQVLRIDYWDMRTQAQGRPTSTPLHVHYHLDGDQDKHPPGRTIWP